MCVHLVTIACASTFGLYSEYSCVLADGDGMRARTVITIGNDSLAKENEGRKVCPLHGQCEGRVYEMHETLWLPGHERPTQRLLQKKAREKSRTMHEIVRWKTKQKGGC